MRDLTMVVVESQLRKTNMKYKEAYEQQRDAWKFYHDTVKEFDGELQDMVEGYKHTVDEYRKSKPVEDLSQDARVLETIKAAHYLGATEAIQRRYRELWAEKGLTLP